jgi:hypothetical protein
LNDPSTHVARLVEAISHSHAHGRLLEEHWDDAVLGVVDGWPAVRSINSIYILPPPPQLKTTRESQRPMQ